MNGSIVRTMLKSLVVVIVAVAALAALSPALAALTDDKDGGAKTLIKLDDDWSKAAATRDAEKVASFYAEDAIVYPPGGPMAVGRAAARTIWAAYFADPTFTISWKTLHAEVSTSGDLGYTSGPYQASFKGPDGTLVKEKGKYLCVWKKDTKGAWRAVHDMWNTDAP